MRSILLFLGLGVAFFLQAQTIRPVDVQPDSTNYANVYVKKMAEDSLQSTFIIWVKKEVKPHFHAHHTELIAVLDGSGTMTLDGQSFTIQKGDFFMIPMGSVHSVITTSTEPLKVMSIQSPRFDGDRIWVDQ